MKTDWVAAAAPRLKRDWLRHKVRLTAEIYTSQARIPAGALGRIERIQPGKCWIIFDACKCCGMSPVVTIRHERKVFEFLRPADIGVAAE